MRVTIVKEDVGYTMIVGGEALSLESLPLDANISAIQWYGDSGEVEYCNCQEQPNEPITDSALIGQCLSIYNAEKARLEQERQAAEEAWLNSWDRIRRERDALIAETDWMILPDAPLTESEVAEVKAYRQALRDIPQDFGAPADVVWPAMPAAVEERLGKS